MLATIFTVYAVIGVFGSIAAYRWGNKSDYLPLVKEFKRSRSFLERYDMFTSCNNCNRNFYLSIRKGLPVSEIVGATIICPHCGVYQEAKDVTKTRTRHYVTTSKKY